MKPRDREQTIAHHMNYCQHYDGHALISAADAVCKAGARYKDVGPDAKSRPCMRGHERSDALVLCPKWVRTTREQAEAKVDEQDRALEIFFTAVPVVNAWKNKKRPFFKAGVIECPVCKGKLHLHQDGRNGHVAAQCETPECVRFIE